MIKRNLRSQNVRFTHKKVDSGNRLGYTELNMAGPSAFVYGSAFYILG